MSKRLVQDFMASNVTTVNPDTTLPDAHRLMTDKGIRRLPVLEKGVLTGIISLSDVQEAEPSDATSLSVWEMNYLLAKLTVGKVMTRNPLTIAGRATVKEAAQIMLDNKIGGLPVVDESGKLVGIITESDIFRMVVQEWSEDD